ncbi:MAG TPA: DUF1684 domain-containing protein [Stenotrophomonas sp.]|nr:DUF1684 domain-containing protein [Stenotrophomonas sp.]
MAWRTWALCALIVAVAACSDGAGNAAPAPTLLGANGQDAYTRELENWRQARLAALRAADGWLSYTGSGRLRLGSYRVGTAADNDISLSSGPPRLGVLTVEENRIRFDAARDVDVRLRGQPVTSVTLVPEEAGRKADRLDVGQSQFYVVRTGPVFGWRFRDPAAPARHRFAGIDHFPVDPRWRVTARWQPYAKPQPITLLTSIGTPLPAWIPGEAVFVRDGHQYRLHPVTQPNDPRLFFIFSDRTSGKDTYGGARYLFVDPPADGHLVLDFNRAENPPCALTPHLVCPIAPPGNRLDLAVNAGEKTFISNW